jgi:DNA polymerase-1
MTKKLLHIIDGSGYIFRAYYAVRPLSTAKGQPTNAIYGFTTMIEKALREEQPEYLAITFDAGGPQFRQQLYTEYKANRPPPPEDLSSQVPKIREIAEAFQIKTFRVPGVEADDVIATLVRRALEAGFEVCIITGDKDLTQLVSDRVSIYEPMKGQRFHPKEVEEKFGVPPAAIADALALAGDASDNVPGVKGVGGKTAAKLIHEHGTLAKILEAAKAGKIKGKMGETLATSEADAWLSRQLVALKDDVELGIADLDELKYPGPDKARLKDLYVELEFRRLSPKLEEEGGANSADGEAPGPSVVPAVAVAIKTDGYQIVTTDDGLAEVVRALEAAPVSAWAVETDDQSMVDAMVWGLAVAPARGAASYLPLAHRYLGAPKQLSLNTVLTALRPILERADRAKVSAESKVLVELCRREGIEVRGLAFDTTLASYLLEPDETQHGAVAVARRYLDHDPLDRAAALKGQEGFEVLPVELACKLAGERADISLAASEILRPALDQAQVLPVLVDVELPLIPVLAKMELAGVKIDVAQLTSMSETFAVELVSLEKACYEAAGKEFNIGSPKQLQKILFEELGLRIIKTTKTGPSTDHAVLEQLANDHPLPQTILDHRQVQKLKSTYVDALPKMVSKKTGRVHTVFNQATAATGRLSSNDPNLQNIPIRSELGRKLRQVFVAEPGHRLVSVDYSQIELRVLAHFCRDEVLSTAFRENADVHTRTASVLFNVPPAEVTREQRTQAKAVNFGVLYGMGPMRLARDLKLPRKVATQFIEDYFVRQPGVAQYLKDTVEAAEKSGEVRTLLGRRRLVPDLHSRNRGSREAAKRVAVNTPIQGSAADLIKLAMIRVDAILAETFPKARLLLQVHDELLLEVPEAETEAVAAMVKREMEHVYPLEVPLLAEARHGKNWDEAH